MSREEFCATEHFTVTDGLLLRYADTKKIKRTTCSDRRVVNSFAIVLSDIVIVTIVVSKCF